MAQSQANLKVDITADVGKATAQIGLLQAELRKLRAEHRALADQMQKGAGDPTRYAELSRQIGTVDRQLRQLVQTQRASTRATEEHALGFNHLSREVLHFGHAIGLPIEGLRALRFGIAGFSVGLVVRGITEAIAKINEFNVASRETGASVGYIKGLQEAFRAAGDDANKAVPLLANFNKVAREARMKETAAYWGGPGTGQPFDPADPLKALNISAANYQNTIAGQNRLRQDTAKALLQRRDAGQIDEANVLSLKLYGQELDAILPEVQKIAAGIKEAGELTKEQSDIMGRLNNLVAETASLWERVTTNIGLAGAALAVGVTNAENWRNALSNIPAASASAPIPPAMASGGFVSGPGTSTSDSIPARLSAGEFVLNAASVRRLGVGFLQGLNNFATGGLVMQQPVRFAAGGLAGASPGTPVHLHLGGHSFALAASQAVAGALVTEANRQRMQSAGIKPSWFAGRPGN